MEQYGLSMNVLHKFLNTTRAYLELARKPAAPTERRQIARLPATAQPAALGIAYRANAPA